MPDFYSIQDVLTFAIHLEQASQEYYRHLSDTAHSPSVSRFLAAMVEEEKLHEQRLKQLMDDEGVMLTKSISAQDVDGYIHGMQVPESMDYKEAVKLAMDKEKAAQMLYSVIAAVMEDDLLAQLFLQLSAQEYKHWQFFDKIYQQICLSEN